MPKHQVSHRTFNKKTYSLWTGSLPKDSAQRAAKSKRKEGYRARVVKVKLDDGGHSFAVYTRRKSW